MRFSTTATAVLFIATTACGFLCPSPHCSSPYYPPRSRLRARPSKVTVNNAAGAREVAALVAAATEVAAAAVHLHVVLPAGGRALAPPTAAAVYVRVPLPGARGPEGSAPPWLGYNVGRAPNATAAGVVYARAGDAAAASAAAAAAAAEAGAEPKHAAADDVLWPAAASPDAAGGSLRLTTTIQANWMSAKRILACQACLLEYAAAAPGPVAVAAGAGAPSVFSLAESFADAAALADHEAAAGALFEDLAPHLAAVRPVRQLWERVA